MFKYYCVDWAIFVLVLIHLWLLGNQKRSAFPVGMVASCCALVFGIMSGSVATVVMNIVFFFLHLRAYGKWKVK